MPSEPSNGGIPDDAPARTVRVFTSREAAEIAAANLQARGIHCWIIADDGGGMLPSLAAPGGVRLLVGTSDEAAAIALLEGGVSSSEFSAQNESELAAAPFKAELPREMIAAGQIIVGIVIGALLCLLYQKYAQPRNWTHYHYDQNGKPDEAWIYRDRALAEHRKDRNHDGAWDHWVYYENGAVARSDVDNNFDGTPDETWTYSNGTVAQMEKDTDFNGTPDEFCTYKFGVLQQVDMRPNGAKFATMREMYQNGVVAKILREPDGHGNFKEAVSYDPFFNPISTNKLQ